MHVAEIENIFRQIVNLSHTQGHRKDLTARDFFSSPH